MDSALSSQAATMAAEFGYRPRTPLNDTRSGSPQVAIEKRATGSLLASPASPLKSVEGSSSPTRKKSRFLDSLRLKPPRNAQTITDENGSPKSFSKRKSISNLLAFSSTRSRRAPDTNNVDGCVQKKEPENASPSKRPTLNSTSLSRMNRRKSLGDIWGSISSRVSPRRDATVEDRCPDRYNGELNLSLSMSGALDPTAGLKAIPIVEQSDVQVPTQRSQRDSGVDVDSHSSQNFRESSISSSMAWYEESPRSSTQTNGVESSTALPSTSVDKGKERVIHASPAIDEGEAKATSSSTKIDKGKQKAVDFSITCNKGEARTPDSYLNLLIAACDDPKTPDSYLRKLLDTSSVANSPIASPCLHRDSDHQSISWGDSTLVEHDENHEDDEEFSAPPPYTSNDISNSELGEVTFSETDPCEHCDHSGTRYNFPVVTIREVDPSEEFPDPPANIDTVFHLRGGDRRSRYERLMKSSRSMGRSSDESIENRLKTTIAKMTKNYHVGSSSEEWSEDTSATRYSDQIEFETDQMEVWDSIIVGSRILQEAKPFRKLKRMPSSEHSRHPHVEKILQESIKLRQLSEEEPNNCSHNNADVVVEDSISTSDREQRSQRSSSRRRQLSSAMVRVEFPQTMNLATHAEMYESKSKAITSLYEYKLGELSNFCTYDPSTRTIFAHALESSVPSPAALRAAGREILWLPMQMEIHHLIQFREKTQNDIDLSRDKDQSSATAEEQSAREAKHEDIATESSGLQLNPDTLWLHDKEMMAANVYNFDRHGSQFEPEAEFIGPRSPSSSLQLEPASPERGKEPSTFGDDFFLEVDSNFAESFFGSQYSGKSCCTSRASTSDVVQMLPDRLLETKSADELLWSLEDQNQDARPVKTWAELARMYLADHRAQAVRSSEFDNKSTDGDFERAELLGFSARSSPTGPQIEHIEDVKAHKEGHFSKERYHRQSSVSSIRREDVEDISKWAEQFIHSGRSSPTEQIEEKYKYRGDSDWKTRHSRRSRLAPYLAEEGPELKPPKRFNRYPWMSESWSHFKCEQPLFSLADSETMNSNNFGSPKRESRQLFESSNKPETLGKKGAHVIKDPEMKDSSQHKTIDIPFPMKDGSDEYSQRSSISFTSYIEAERARERLHQTYPFPPSFQAETETKSEEFVTNTCRVHKDSAVDEKSSAEVGYLERNIVGKLERQLDSSQVQKLARKSEMVSSEETSGSAGLMITGSRPAGYNEHLTCEGIPQNFETGSEISEDSEDSAISTFSLPCGFKFTAHRRQLMKSDDPESALNSLSGSSRSVEPSKSTRSAEKIYSHGANPEHPATKHAAPTTLQCAEASLAITSSSTNDFAGSQETGADHATQTIVRHSGSEELAIQEIRENLLSGSRRRDCTVEQSMLQHKMVTNTNLDKHLGEKSREGFMSIIIPNEGLTDSQEHNQDPEIPAAHGSLNQAKNAPSWQAKMEDLNIRVVGKAARQAYPARVGDRIGTLVDIFQAHGIMPGTKQALHPKKSAIPLLNKCRERRTTPTARIVKPSGSLYHPAGAVCLPNGRPLSRSPIKRVLTPKSPIFRPSSGASSVITDASESFGENLERVEKHPQACFEEGNSDEVI